QTVIGAMGSHATASRRMPPVLHVALQKLPPCRHHQMRTGQVRAVHHQRHAILNLIAESICAPGLVEARSTPDATTERLIQEPAVKYEVESALRCLHLHHSKRSIPCLGNLGQSRARIELAIALDKRPGGGVVGSLSQQKDDAGLGARRDAKPVAQHCAGIEISSYSAAQWSVYGKCAWTLQRPI